MFKSSSKITHRLLYSFVVLILVFFLFGLNALYDIRTISGLTRTIYNHPLVVSNAALQSNVSITKMHRHMKDVVLFKSADRIKKSIIAVAQQEKLVYEYLDIVRSRILGAQGQQLENEARKLFQEWLPIREEVIELVRWGEPEKAAEITIGKGANHVVALEQKMLGLTAYARTKASEFMQETEETKSRLNVTTIFFLFLGIFISVIVALFTIKHAASSERSLKESENRYRMLVESQVDLVSRFTSDGKYNFVNEVFCQFFDKSKEELIGYEWQPLPVDDDREYIEGELAKLSPHNPTVIVENRVYSGQGEIHWMQFINKGFFDSEGKLLEIQSVGRDITERKHSEKLVKESLKEKEVLLKEIHHRVKNNMQIIQSLLNIQSHKINEPELKQPLIESNSRIKSMALVHEILYHSEDIAKLNIEAYFQKICEHLITVYSSPAKKISISVSVDPIQMNMDYCIASGLIINELVSNALKYAFMDRSEGKIAIALNKDGHRNVTLIVSDDGVGFPDSFSIAKTESMGLNIVRMLAEDQLNGTISVKKENGASFQLRFALPPNSFGTS